jgi:hypothetical protein
MHEPKQPLSASRIKLAQSCSWLYYSRYFLNLPDSGNDGSSRGTIVHEVFELLGDPKEKINYDKIVKSQDPFSVKKIKNLIVKLAEELKVDDEDNLDLIKEMILNGLSYDFYGDKLGKPTEAISEKDFEIVVAEEGKSYKIKGFIDKLFLYKKKKYALIRDFKSSKQKFKGKEITDNLQDYMYSLAVKRLYPEYKNRQSEFLFLKFELDDEIGEQSNGVIKMNPISEDDLEGFEYYLTELQEYLDNFDESDARSNFAANQDYPSDKSFGGPLMCGFAKQRGQLKLDGTPMWHCPARHPFDYYVILNDKGEIVKSYEEDKFKSSFVEEGFTFEKRSYKGCPRHYNW